MPNGDKHVTLTRTEVGMVKAMTVKTTDTRTFNHFDSVDFAKIKAVGKEHGVTPPVVMVKHLGQALEDLGLNQKLDGEKRTRIIRKSVDIGIAVDVGEGLRTLVLRDVTNKSYQEINEQIQEYVKLGSKVAPEDQDLTTVGWSVTSLGKMAARFAVSVLPPGTAGIMSLGRMAGENGNDTMLSTCMCHATLTGAQGAAIMRKVRESFE
jgi:pyruvate/2-oxoglutarate dehydrogenase complex dihydrolipoamide acyltransferase (E2) component